MNNLSKDVIDAIRDLLFFSKRNEFPYYLMTIFSAAAWYSIILFIYAVILFSESI